VDAKGLRESNWIAGAKLGGTVQMWEWIGDGATTFSY
ncbi:MAG: peroxiredoxin, partial [Actinomycetes bacterium]